MDCAAHAVVHLPRMDHEGLPRCPPTVVNFYIIRQHQALTSATTDTRRALRDTPRVFFILLIASRHGVPDDGFAGDADGCRVFLRNGGLLSISISSSRAL
jgi:hypothetical protein